MDSTKPGPLKAGDTFLGKYEIRSLLGRGGHAFVYEAYDPFLDRSVAIKVVKSPKDAGRDLGKRARSEAQVLSRADHKNLVKVLDAGISEGLVYLIMEKLVGRTLRDALRDLSRLSAAEALVVGVQVAEGMEVAHREQVIHRDLKPENIFIEAGNSTKVLDFGIAKVLGVGAHPETTERDLLQGTVLYMSPEHLQGIGVTPKSDIYALGTILFEALYAHPLAVGEKPAGLQEAAWMQIAKVPPMLDELDRTIPHFIAKLVQRAIVKIPEQRYATMADFREALSAGLARLRAETGTHSSQVVLRDLSVARPAPRVPELESTVRKDQVSTGQVTTAAPHVMGDTEQYSRAPFTVPASQYSAATVLAAPHARDERTPMIYGAVPQIQAPRPWEDATVLAMQSPVAHAPQLLQPPHAATLQSAQSPHAAHPSHLGPHGTARLADAPVGAAVSPSTAPPVSSLAPLKVKESLVKDRGVRFAVLSALVIGVVGGTTYGVVATRSAPAPAESAAASVSTSAEPVVVAPPAPVVATPATATATPSVSASSAPPAPSVAKPQTPSKAAPAAKARPPSAADSDLQERLDWLDRDSKSPAGTKP